MTKKEEMQRYREQLTRWMGNIRFSVEELVQDSTLSNLEMWVTWVDKRTKGGKILIEALNRKRAEG